MNLRYGMNPHQTVATATPIDPASRPFRIVHGVPSYINILDAAGAWQLVREAATALGRPVAASFKHVSPAGAATAGPLDAVMAQHPAGPAEQHDEPGQQDPRPERGQLGERRLVLRADQVGQRDRGAPRREQQAEETTHHMAGPDTTVAAWP